MGILKKLWIVFAVWLILAAAAPAGAAQQRPCGDEVTVVYGDALREIANRCNTSVEALLQANPSINNPDQIEIGQRLNIPGLPVLQDPDTAFRYNVVQGDILSEVASRFDTTVPAIVQANPAIADPNLIHVNQTLLIPVQDETGPTVTITPWSGSPGTKLQVTASGFPPNSQVEVGIGPWESEYEVVSTIQTDTSGELSTQVTIPEYARPDDRWVAVVTTPPDPTQSGDRLREISTPFAVTTGQNEDGVPVFSSVNVFLTALDQGDIGCNDAIVPVERDIAPTQAPLTAAIQELVSLEERTYGQSGFYNALHQSDLRLGDINLEDGNATIRLVGEYQVGGVCDVPRVAAQLRQTALQFDTVDEVEIIVNNQPLEAPTVGR